MRTRSLQSLACQLRLQMLEEIGVKRNDDEVGDEKGEESQATAPPLGGPRAPSFCEISALPACPGALRRHARNKREKEDGEQHPCLLCRAA